MGAGVFVTPMRSVVLVKIIDEKIADCTALLPAAGGNSTRRETLTRRATLTRRYPQKGVKPPLPLPARPIRTRAVRMERLGFSTFHNNTFITTKQTRMSKSQCVYMSLKYDRISTVTLTTSNSHIVGGGSVLHKSTYGPGRAHRDGTARYSARHGRARELRDRDRRTDLRIPRPWCIRVLRTFTHAPHQVPVGHALTTRILCGATTRTTPRHTIARSWHARRRFGLCRRHTGSSALRCRSQAAGDPTAG